VHRKTFLLALCMALCSARLLGTVGFAATQSFAPGPPGTIVLTDQGRVRGVLGDGVREFRGIPFAAPPVGERRWASPAPVDSWNGILDATHYRDACPQVSRYGLTEASDVEDCLYLNVATPVAPARNGKPRAVLVWIHGGAFVGGGANLYPLDYLALEGDLVVVSINYRLGALGYLSHPAFPADRAGGYALEDQRAALRWVHRNITAFGGDAHNVTIAGESAGAANVCMQLFAPEEATGLFHRAIVQSAGCARRLRTVEEAQSIGLKVAAKLGCSDPNTAAACLRAAPLQALLQAQTEVTAAELIAFAPSVGSTTLPRQPLEALDTGNFVRVPMMNGGNRDEMRLYVGYDVAAGRKVTPENYAAALVGVYGAHGAEVLAHYPLAAYPSAPSALGSAMSDYQPSGILANCGFLETARRAARHVPVFEYEFTDRAAPPVMDDPGFELGAVHSAELPYLFPHFSNKTVLDGPELAPGSQRLSGQMVRYWAAFAHLGRPDAKGLPVWPRFRSAANVLRLNPDTLVSFDAAAAHQCAFWQSLYPRELGP
jgi:para-nitrobenzyl esterase